tara:strand:+ start:3262 stop:3750 length:489 start_codon:yes stop_codon:yes gene_type:complete
MPKFEKIDENRKDLFVTGSVNKDQKKLREFYKDNIKTFIKAFDVTKKILNINDDKILFIRNIRSYAGFYRNAKKEIAIDIRSRNIKDIISTIIHECTHALQYQNGDLKKDIKNPRHFIWLNKDSIRKYSPKQNHKKYMNLPWEIQAREFEKKYIDQVMKEVK